MSKTSPGSFSMSGNKFYDPDFTAQISCRMQVPDKISLNERPTNIAPEQENANAFMHVPERILVAGGDEHIAAREPLPELRMESALPDETTNTGLVTPPRVLTLNQYSYPGIEVNHEDRNQETQIEVQKSVGNGLTEFNESSLMFRRPEDQIIMLSKQLRLLNQRINSLEIQNQVRQQRELMLYSVVSAYLVLKGLLWLHRHF